MTEYKMYEFKESVTKSSSRNYILDHKIHEKCKSRIKQMTSIF